MQKASTPQGNYKVEVIRLQAFMKRVEIDVLYDPAIDVGLSPNHPHANIHGTVGVNSDTHKVSMTCKTVEGKMCTGCCWGSSEEFMGKKCIQQIPEAGCVYDHLDTPSLKPKSCQEYHCSYDLGAIDDNELPVETREESYLRATTANLASLKAGEIEKDIFKQNQKRIGASPVPLTKSRMKSIMSANDRRTPQLKRLLLLLQKESI